MFIYFYFIFLKISRYSFAIIFWEIITTHYNTYQEPFQEFQITFDTILEANILQGLIQTIFIVWLSKLTNY